MSVNIDQPTTVESNPGDTVVPPSGNSPAEAPASLESIGLKLKEAVAPPTPESIAKEIKNEPKPTAPAKAQAEDPKGADAPRKGKQPVQPDPLPEPFEYKADGKTHKVTDRNELLKLLSAGHNYTQKSQTLKSDFDKKTQAYRSFEAEIQKDPAFSQAIGLLYNAPELL